MIAKGGNPLNRLIAVVGLAAALAVTLTLLAWSRMDWSWQLGDGVALAIFALAGEFLEAPISLGGHRQRVSWGEASLLFGLAFLPAPEVIMIKIVAVVIEQCVHRRGAKRIIFNSSAAAIYVSVAATAAAALAAAGNVSLEQPIGWPFLAIGGLIASVLSCSLVACPISLSTATKWHRVMASASRDQAANYAGNLLLSFCIIAAWRYSRETLVALPLLFILLWQAHNRRVHKGTEKDALHRLAKASAAMPALSLVEMTDEVKRRAADLFGARDIHLRLQGGMTHFPQSLSAATVETAGIEVPLVGRQGELGSLRLDVDQSGDPTQQEWDVLTTFANTTAAALETVLAHAAQLHAAQHDTLTGLPNRALLAAEANRMLAAAEAARGRCAVIMLDLDGFKNVNDTLGHAAGDQLLVEIGTRLGGSVRVSDCVARLGGDEFVVMLDRLESDVDAGQLAATLVERVSVPVTIDGLRLAVEASAGVALYPEHGSTIESLLRCADVAMYDAKRRGDSVVHYNCSQDLASPERLGLLADLQSALDADDQLHLHFQPQLDLRTGRPGNVEALVRWKHPTRGPLSPAEFVPVIEHSALIGAFTVKVLDEAVSQCVGWQSDASLHGVGVAVNLSARNLMHRDLPDEVARILARHGLPARKLVLEITETAAMNDTEVCESVLGRLRDLGVRLSVDDFGTGYASLTFLRRIDVAEVKLDRAFVADMLDDEAAATIVGATVALAHGLGLTVVAEGVETAEQLAALNLAGCDLAQGYFLSRPIPVELLPDGADSAVAKAAKHGVIEAYIRQPAPPRPRGPGSRSSSLASIGADQEPDQIG